MRPLLDMVALNRTAARGYEGFWAVIRELDRAGSWTLHDVEMRSNVHRRTVSQYVDALRKAGIAKVVETESVAGDWKRNHLRLTRSPLDAPRLRRDGSELPEQRNETLWRTMKMLKVFTPTELVAAASTEKRSISLGYTREYVCLLLAAGVLGVAQAQGFGTEARYRLVQNLGSRAPKILATKVVFDPNSRKTIGEGVVREVGQ